MAAGDAPSTLSELQTDFLEKLKEITGNSTVNTIVTRFLNQALQDMHQERWWWAERHSTIRTNPPYSTGTVDLAITSLTTRRTVTGTSTAWNTANSFGDVNGIGARAKLTLGSSATVHLISSVDSDTQITLDTTTPYTGNSALDDSGYAIYQDEYALQSDFDIDKGPIDPKFFDEDRTIHLIGPQEFARRYTRNSERAGPKHATILELGPSGSTALRPRVVFGPAPDRTYIIPYRYYTTNLAVSSAGAGQRFLSASGDEPIVPHPYRQGIVFKALELWFSSRSRGNPDAAAAFGGQYTTLMLRARQPKTAAQELPRLQPQVASYMLHARRPYRRGARRYDGDAAFDQLRW